MMKKLIYLSLLLSLSAHINIFAQQKVVIGLSQTYQKSVNTYTMFIANNFIFEVISLYNPDSNFTFETIFEDVELDFDTYKNNIYEKSISQGMDYILTSHCYSSKNYLFLKLTLVNPRTREIIYQKVYIVETSYNIYREMDLITRETLSKISNLSLKKTKPLLFVQKKTTETFDFEQEFKSKHELFFQWGGLKVHPEMMSFVSLFSGYCFNPYEFLGLEVGMSFAGGYRTRGFSFDRFGMDTFIIGINHGFHILIPGTYEPSIGIRAEFSYIIGEKFYFSLPIDVGIKIYVTNKNIIRVNAVIQFTRLDIANVSWDQSTTLGIMVGYARKI